MEGKRMSITDTINISGYYDQARKPVSWAGKLGDLWADEIELRSFADCLDASIERWREPLQRWPVRSREPREIIESQKRAIIHERDGGRCRYCGTGEKQLVMDHIIPRSTFEAHDLAIADRSDNLQSACWECNEKRSNFDHPFTKRMGVTVRCWYCTHPDYEDLLQDGEEVGPRPKVTVFCGRCGISAVPSVAGWVL